MNIKTIFFAADLAAYFLKLGKAEKKAVQMEKEGDPDRRKYVFFEVEKWARHVCDKAGAEVEVSGLENLPKQPAVYVCNHQSYFDIPLFLGYIRQAGMFAKIELAGIPKLSFWMRQIGCVFVDRKDKRQSVLAVARAADTVRAGYDMVVFPEGTRSKSGQIAHFKHGAATIAARAAAPVVPVVIDGAYKLYEGNGNKIRPAKIRLTVLPPSGGFEKMSKEDGFAALQKIREDMIKAKNR